VVDSATASPRGELADEPPGLERQGLGERRLRLLWDLLRLAGKPARFGASGRNGRDPLELSGWVGKLRRFV
jgi:hypothetical protein